MCLVCLVCLGVLLARLSEKTVSCAKAVDAITFRVGVLLVGDSEAPFDMQRSGPAIDMAIDVVNSVHLNNSYRIEAVHIAYDNSCSAAAALGYASQLYHYNKTIAFFGPACALALDPTGRLASFWSIPIITGLGDKGIFKFKHNYPTLTRLSYCQCRLRKVFGSTFEHFSWTHIAVLYDRDDEYSNSVGKTLDHGLRLGGINPYVLEFNHDTNYSELLMTASERARSM